MSVDVSPDGETIVFDLLGDLYTLPLAGGTATRITSGPAYDVQPRWSPDGSRISFTSDRSGGDNIWTMDARGEDMQQVSDESFRLLNNAVWTPDGDYLIARKHFTATRSLGAGEMWMYHRTGGSGLQLTERPNDQQDAGEPAVSADGRYVYFSQDVTPGPNFEYNKDPNAGIYAIKRLDRETGEIETILGGTGGAARPEPRPKTRFSNGDSEQLAFVRRVRNETALFLYDGESGAQIPLWDGLSPDQQETWAVFGVYPGFDWTPDGRDIVIWAQGGLWRVPVSDPGEGIRPIPFTVEVEQTVTEAVRFPIDVAPEVFDVKMLRDAATSPDGRTLVFSAVGRLWRKLGDGEAAPITDTRHVRLRSRLLARRPPDGLRDVGRRPVRPATRDGRGLWRNPAAGRGTRPLRHAALLARRPDDRLRAPERQRHARAAQRPPHRPVHDRRLWRGRGT